jgi:hypothetical protein
VGKTTLAWTLGAALGIPVLPEAMRARLESGISLHTLTREEHQRLLRADIEGVAERAADCPDGFVADRTPLDFVAFWLCNGYAAEDPAVTEALIERSRAVMDDWECIVVLPWAGVPLVDDGIRYANPWHQLHAQMVIEGLCRRFVASSRLVFLPAEVDTPETRCNWITAAVARTRRATRRARRA